MPKGLFWVSSIYIMDVPNESIRSAAGQQDSYTVKDDAAQSASLAGTCAQCHRFEWHCVCSPGLDNDDDRLPADGEILSRSKELLFQLLHCSEEVDEEDGPACSDEDDGSSRSVAGKRPRGSDEDGPVPDLSEYFQQWPEMSMEDVIGMCRTHANALQRRVNFTRKRRLATTIARSTESVQRGAALFRTRGAATASRKTSRK